MMLGHMLGKVFAYQLLLLLVDLVLAEVNGRAILADFVDEEIGVAGGYQLAHATTGEVGEGRKAMRLTACGCHQSKSKRSGYSAR